MSDHASSVARALVVCVRGPSRSGKTALCERLAQAFEADGVRCAYVKRTHHPLDLPGKASARIWARQPSAMLMLSPDRLQLTLPPTRTDAATMLAALPPGIELVLLETHSPEPYPTILSALLQPAPGEQPLARWALEFVERDAQVAIAAIRPLLPADRETACALGDALRLHGGHGCAGIVLGTRLALHGTASLGIALPDRARQLMVSVETARCAADAVQAVTGCRIGRRTLRVLDYGKMAATFTNLATGSSIRVSARPDLRSRASALARPGEAPADTQVRVYRELPPELLFTTQTVALALDPVDLPGRPARRVTCVVCHEEVSDGRDIETEAGAVCVPCLKAVENAENPKEGSLV